MEIKKCKKCNITGNETQFYSRIQNVCKECFVNEFEETVKTNGGFLKRSIFEMCKKYDLPFISSTVVNFYDSGKERYTDSIKYYLKSLNLNYINMKFQDGEKEVYTDSIVKSPKEIVKLNTDKSDFLEHERLTLQVRLSHSLEKNDIGTYKNLIQAYERILMLQKDNETWVERFSEYKTKEKDSEVSIPMVSTWEQKGEEIRNTRVFEIANEVGQVEYELYFEVENRDNRLVCHIFFDKKTYKITGDSADFIGQYIETLIGNKKVVAYGDGRGFGMMIVDNLVARGIKVKKENAKIYNPFSHYHEVTIPNHYHEPTNR